MGLFCPICQEDVQAEEPVTGLKCGHLFHTACFDLHRIRGGVSASMCPQCRSPYTNSMRLYPNIENDSNVDKLQQVTDMNEHLMSRIVELEGIILSQTQKIAKLEVENKVYADMILKNPVQTMPVKPVASSVRQQLKFCTEKFLAFAEPLMNENHESTNLELERTKQLKNLSDSDKSELMKLDAVLDRIVIITGMSSSNLHMTTLEFLRSMANTVQWHFDDNDIEATYRRGWNLQKKELIVLLKTTDVKWRMFKMQSFLKKKPDWEFILFKSGYKHDVWELWNYANCLLEHGYRKVYIYSAEVWAFYGNRRINILDHAHVDRLKAAAEIRQPPKRATENEKNAGEWRLKGIAPKEIAAKEHKESTTTTERKQSRTATESKESTTAAEPKESTTTTEHISLPSDLSGRFYEFYEYIFIEEYMGRGDIL